MGSSRMRPTRYAHCDGLTDVCYSTDGNLIITCGQDGDVRLFEGLDDDDCKTHTISDKVHAVGYKDGCILVGTDLNMIQAYTEDDGKPSGIITRFTGHPTCIDVLNNLVAAGSIDTNIKLHDSENFKDSIFSGHEAPVMSVVIDPKGDFIASSSCDGTIRVWNVRTQTIVRSFAVLPKNNSISISSSLCRMKWSNDGMYLFVPIGNEIKVYDRTKWKIEFTLKLESGDDEPSVLAISPCSKYLACGCLKGTVVVWHIDERRVILSEVNSGQLHITSLCWHPSKDELAFVNKSGELGTVENILQEISSKIVPPTIAICKSSTVLNKDGVAEESHFFMEDDSEMDDDDISIAKIKSQLGFADDEEGTFIGLPKADDEISLSNKASTPVPQYIVPVQEFKLPEPQKPFQPGMSADHLNDRYMMWNNTGIVRQYSSSDENSIEVEFHDSSIHHALHLNNHLGHSIAQLNNQMLALGAESQEDQPSKLVVHHFSAWDGSKEWQVDLPELEELQAIGIGDGWVAVATDKHNVRIFSSAGVQRDIVSIPGPIVCLIGHEDSIFIVYHAALGVRGEQSMSCQVLNINGCGHFLPHSIPLPLSPKSYLAWAGFTDEGTPLLMDSDGVVRILRSSMGNCWTSVLNTKEHAKGKSDNYFVLGASESQSIVRCILCKVNRYPPVLPRPHISMLDFKIPLCEVESEKGILEEKTLRSSLLSSTLKRLERKGYDVEDSIAEVTKSLSESLIKLLALACRSDRDSRALEVCQLLPTSSSIQLAIRYAGKLHRNQLAERLSQLAEQKLEEEVRGHVDQNDVEDQSPNYCFAREDQEEDEFECQNLDTDSDALVTDEMEHVDSANTKSANPLLSARNQSKDKSFNATLNSSTRNPFKRSAGVGSNDKGLIVFDSMKAKKKEDAPILRPALKMSKGRNYETKNSKTSKLDSVGKKHTTSGKENRVESLVNKSVNPFATAGNAKKPSALMLWLEENKESVKEKYPDALDAELLGKAALLFRDVDDSVKQKYKNLSTNYGDGVCASSTPGLSNASDGKRKLEETSQETSIEKRVKPSSKLAAFAFAKKDV